MRHCSILWRGLPAVGALCAIFFLCPAASAQAPYPQAQSHWVGGPVIDFQSQAVTLSVAVVGTPFRLHYRGDGADRIWTWSVRHAYDPVAKMLSLGDGRRRPASPLLLAQPPAWLSVGEVAIVAQDGSELYVFNKVGRHLRTLNAFTGALLYRFAYSAAGRVTAIEDGYGNIARIERNANGVATAIVAPYGQRTIFSTDADGHPTSITNPAGEAASLNYSGDGRLVALTDPRGNVYRFLSDKSGHLTKQEDPAGGVLKLARIFTNEGFKVSWNTAMGRASAWLAERPSDSEATAVMTDPGGSEIRLQTRTDGSTKIVYPDGRTLTRTQQPDPRWGLQSPLLKTFSVVTPSGLTSALSVNRTVTLADSGNPLSMTTLTDTMRINGRSYTRTFDAKSKQITRLTPAGRRTNTTLDEHGRVIKVEVPGLLPIGLTYDGQGRLATFTQGTGTETRFGGVLYNAEGWVASVTDPLKRTIRFEYDPAGRVSKRILPDGREISYTYDANGNRISITPPGRPIHSFDYTPVNLIKAYLPPHVEQGRGDTSYVYNNDGQLAKMLRPDRTATEFAYDKGGRLSAVTGPGGEVRFGYDPKTTYLTTITAPDGGALAHTYDGSLLTRAAWTGTIKGTVSFTYDNNLRTTSTSVNGEPPITLEYDPDGLLTRAGSLGMRPDPTSGLLAGTVLGNVTTSQEYNGFGEITLLRGTFKDREISADRYERDALGRIVRKTETLDGQTNAYAYAYDSAGRLTDVTTNGTHTTHYEYDANGNRIVYVGLNGTVNASYDAQDHVKQYGNATYASTANGEWLSKTVEGKTTTYSYDAFGNLKAASLPDGTKIDYVVDGANRRIGKKINGKLVQGFLYQDQLKVIAELDGQNQVVARFVYAASSNVPDYMTKGGKTYRIVTDHLWSPRIVIDADTGAIAQRMDFDESGNVLRDTSPGFQPFGFAGGIYDQDTKLVRFGRRDYDAHAAAWTAKDAMLFVSGSTNLYEYCLGDTVNAVDPSGLWTEGVGLGGSIGGGTGTVGLQVIYTVDGQGHAGIVVTIGGGGGEGLSAGGGIAIQGSNAQTVEDLSGPFMDYGAGGAVGGRASGEVFYGDSEHGPVSGGTFTAGLGMGGSSWIERTYTWVWPVKPPTYSFNDPLSDALADWWHCHGVGSGDASGCKQSCEALGVSRDSKTGACTDVCLQPGQVWCPKENRCVPGDYWNCGNCGCGKGR